MPASTSTTLRRGDVLQRRDAGAEAAEQALRLALLRLQPDLLQRRDDPAVAQHRAEHRHGFVDGADRQLGLAEARRERGQQRRCMLGHVHFADRLRVLGTPRAEPLQQLHAAERERERARIGADILVDRTRVEERDLCLGQRARRMQGERQPDRSGADHGQLQRTRFVHDRTPLQGIVLRGRALLFAAPGCPGHLSEIAAMALMDFIKKQFIDIIEWTEDSDGTLAWRYPMEDREIQNGGSLTVRESQIAMFVNEGKVADVFGPGRYTLTTATLPILTYLQNWDKLFKSPFKSDVYFFSTRQQIDQRWGTSQR
jgi:hypothetical protein